MTPLRVGLLAGSLSRAGGGIFETVRSLARQLCREALDVRVFGLRDPSTEADRASWGDIPLAAFPVSGPRAFGYAGRLGGALADASLDVLHVHGLWMYPSVAASHWGRRAHAPRLVSPHGMLDAWALANSHWRKAIASRLYESAHLRGADCIHALCTPEVAAIRKYGLRNPVCVIPNGIDPIAAEPLEPPAWRRSLPVEAKIVLSLGRLHPKKNLGNLLRAWRLLSCDPAWHLVIAGWDQGGHQDELRALAASLEITERLRFIGAQYDDAKAATLASADIFIQPSLSEGLPMAVLEAWAHRLPVLMTHHCNLPEGFTAAAALPLNTDPESIAAQLTVLTGMGETRRRAIGAAGAELVARQFTWPAVTREMLNVYRWLLGRAERPSCVQLV